MDCYASDITRTFPVNGRFSPEQRALYEIVLEANYAAIERVKPGNHWNEPHEAAVRVITQGLVKLGLLKGKVAKLEESGAYRKFFMHRTGHWLGMDVHDVGDYKIGNEWRVFEPGMALTIEPGIYVAPGTPGAPKKFHGIGIRIEDDVVVTRDGCEVLTDGVPKEAVAHRTAHGVGGMKPSMIRRRNRRRRHGRRELRAGAARHPAARPAHRKRARRIRRRSPASTNAPPRSATARARSSRPSGVWPAMAAEAAPIRSIHVSDAGRFGVARLDAREQGVHAFGYVVPNRVIGRVLWQALRAAPNVTLAVPAQLKRATLRDDGVLLEIDCATA